MDALARLHRLLRVWHVGERVIAVRDIKWPDHQVHISQLGVVEAVIASGYLVIRWDGLEGYLVTSPDCVDRWGEIE